MTENISDTKKMHSSTKTKQKSKKRPWLKRKKRKRRWTEEDKEYLRENYRYYDIPYLARKLRRTEMAILSYAQILDVQKRKPWKKDEVKILRANYPQKEIRELATMLKRSYQSVATKLIHLNLHRHPYSNWIENILAYIEAKDNEYLKELMKRVVVWLVNRENVPRIWDQREVWIMRELYPTIKLPAIARLLRRRNYQILRDVGGYFIRTDLSRPHNPVDHYENLTSLEGKDREELRKEYTQRIAKIVMNQ